VTADEILAIIITSAVSIAIIIAAVAFLIDMLRK